MPTLALRAVNPVLASMEGDLSLSGRTTVEREHESRTQHASRDGLEVLGYLEKESCKIKALHCLQEAASNCVEQRVYRQWVHTVFYSLHGERKLIL